MPTLAIDLETYSSADIRKTGVYRYAEAPDFEILLFAYAWDDGPVTVIDLAQGEKLPEVIVSALTDKRIVKTAFNASFERTCLARALGIPMPADQWSCTAVLARELGLPGSLEDACLALGLPEDKQKSRVGKALIRYFCQPCKETKTNGGRTRNLPAHDLDKWALFVAYNRQDVEAERAVRMQLSKYSVFSGEQTLWELDQRINDRGVLCDFVFARMAVEYDDIVKDRLLRRAQELTGLSNPKSTAQLKEWIENTSGVAVDSLGKDKIKGLREAIQHDDVHAMLDIRSSLAKTSTEKYAAMLRTASLEDGRIRGLTQFYGAGRTGRWAGRMVQMQNLPKNVLPDSDLDLARALVRAGDFGTMEIMFDRPTHVLSQLIRTAFIPKPGCRFIVADFSAIEARMIAWLANESWRMDVFNSHGKIYEASAEQMFKLPPGSVKKGDPMRQKGKIAELALGYGGSVGALRKMGALDMGLAEAELPGLVGAWRKANPAITKFWWDADEAFRQVVTTQQPKVLHNGIWFHREGPFLRLRLPSGRELAYAQPRLVEDKLMYRGVNQTTTQWSMIDTYGPKIVENIVQAASRDCLAVAIERCEAAGLPVVFHVHDEVILEVPIGVSSAAEVAALVAEPIPWADGLPLKADAYECEYYRKD